MSATKCIERGRREHEDLVAEFRSLMSGVEATLQSTGMTLSRMPGDDLFLEIKRALHPLGNDRVPYSRPGTSVTYESARSQIANVNIEDELDEYLKIGGLLYSFRDRVWASPVAQSAPPPPPPSVVTVAKPTRKTVDVTAEWIGQWPRISRGCT